MTKTELYTFVTTLLDGVQIDETTFETFLDIAQENVEDIRPWVILRDIDNAQSVAGGFTTPYNLNANFKEWYDEQHSVAIVDGNNNPTYLHEVPMAMKFQYKDSPYRFYVDYSQNKLYICGTPTPGTLYQFFIKSSPLVSAGVSPWIFPSRYHKILGLYVAIYWKQGVDYDIVSNLQATQQATQATAILDEMTRWDSRLQKFQQTGVDYGGVPQNGRNASGGFVPYL